MPDILDGNFAPITTETDVADLPVTGSLPRELRGALLRNGPNPQFPSDHPGAHWFTGDGMLHAVRVEDGRASYSNRWVRTSTFLEEREADRRLHLGFGAAASPDAVRDGKARGRANTNILSHGGRLLALEEAHLPVEIDPRTLGTIGPCDFAGALSSPFTAHPKIDPLTGEMVFFGYHADGPLGAGLVWGTVDAQGRLVRSERFMAPYASMVHDFMVTAEHIMFPILPLTASLARAQAGQAPYLWEPDAGAYVGVMRRDTGAASLRWFRADACYVFHVMNAWESDGSLFADVMQYDAPPLFPRAKDVPQDTRASARPVRWALDLCGATDRIVMSDLDDLEGEFPRIDDRFAGHSNGHGWFAANLMGGERVAAGIAHLNLAQGTRKLWTLPEGDATSEPVFVPRGQAEGDGWLLAIAWRARDAVSDLVVLDAQAMEAGPVATVRLPNRVPFGFHGNWIAA